LRRSLRRRGAAWERRGSSSARYAKSEGYYVFLVSYKPQLVVVPENGNLGNQSKLQLADVNLPTPGMARWRFSKAQL